MDFGSFRGRGRGEYNGVSFVEISKIFGRHHLFFFGMISLARVPEKVRHDLFCLTLICHSCYCSNFRASHAFEPHPNIAPILAMFIDDMPDLPDAEDLFPCAINRRLTRCPNAVGGSQTVLQLMPRSVVFCDDKNTAL